MGPCKSAKRFRALLLNLSYDKLATQTAFCFTTPLPNELRAILRVLLASGRRRISGQRFSPPQFLNGEKRRMKIRLRSLASKKSVQHACRLRKDVEIVKHHSLSGYRIQGVPNAVRLDLMSK